MSVLSQFFPPKPEFKEDHVPDLANKVFIVTGANTGLGSEVANILYSKNATVYVGARNEPKARAAMDKIRSDNSNSTGALRFLKVDLSDLPSCSAAADSFLGAESRLDGLFNNAGILNPPHGSKSAQGYELQLGTNCVGPFLLTKKLMPILQSTARDSPKGSVRVVWVSSSAAESLAPKEGIQMDNLDYRIDKGSMVKYGVSKAGNYFQAMELARRYEKDGIVSVAVNPGNLRSELDRDSGILFTKFHHFISYPPINGAYTQIYAAFSPEVKTGSWVIPFGRLGEVRQSLQNGTKPESEGGNGIGRKFWEWLDDQVKPYV